MTTVAFIELNDGRVLNPDDVEMIYFPTTDTPVPMDKKTKWICLISAFQAVARVTREEAKFMVLKALNVVQSAGARQALPDATTEASSIVPVFKLKWPGTCAPCATHVTFFKYALLLMVNYGSPRFDGLRESTGQLAARFAGGDRTLHDDIEAINSAVRGTGFQRAALGGTGISPDKANNPSVASSPPFSSDVTVFSPENQQELMRMEKERHELIVKNEKERAAQAAELHALQVRVYEMQLTFQKAQLEQNEEYQIKRLKVCDMQLEGDKEYQQKRIGLIGYAKDSIGNVFGYITSSICELASSLYSNDNSLFQKRRETANLEHAIALQRQKEVLGAELEMASATRKRARVVDLEAGAELPSAQRKSAQSRKYEDDLSHMIRYSMSYDEYVHQDEYLTLKDHCAMDALPWNFDAKTRMSIGAAIASVAAKHLQLSARDLPTANTARGCESLIAKVYSIDLWDKVLKEVFMRQVIAYST